MHFKYAKFDFSESIFTPKNQSKLPRNDFLNELLPGLIITGKSFSKALTHNITKDENSKLIACCVHKLF